MPREIGRYRALERLTIRNPNGRQPREIDVGEEFEFDGRPGAALMPLNASARANKLRAILAGPGPHRPAGPVRLAKSLGFEGDDHDAAQAFIQKWIARETLQPTTASSPLISSTQEH